MTRTKRHDGRTPSQLRTVKITPDFVSTADGSCLIEIGGTRVICTASLTEGLPRWRQDIGQGWITAEYGMLPASTGLRKKRPTSRPDSRSVEIQRLIGRVLRSVVRFERLGENTVVLDCDVLEADGGTRTAAITGAYVALSLALDKAGRTGLCKPQALRGAIAAVSVGLVDGQALLDLDYLEDSAADVDMNVAMTRSGKFVEIQATSERQAFDSAQLQRMLRLARRGIRQLLDEQKNAFARRKKK